MLTTHGVFTPGCSGNQGNLEDGHAYGDDCLDQCGNDNNAHVLSLESRAPSPIGEGALCVSRLLLVASDREELQDLHVEPDHSDHDAERTGPSELGGSLILHTALNHVEVQYE